MPPTFEEILTGSALFGLTTASPLQRAICRLIEGRPLRELATEPSVISAIGTSDTADIPRPREVLLLAGIRSGKSLMTAALAVFWSQVCDVSKLGPGEVPRISILSLKKDLADVVLGHLTGRVLDSGFLSQLVMAPPGKESLLLRHPTGRPIEIRVVAGSRAGSSVVARWSAGLIADEAPRMFGRDDGVVNIQDLRHAVSRRLLPGAQLAMIGSPWSPASPVAKWYSDGFGKPSREMLVIRAPAYHMNPVVWTPEAVEEAKADPDVYRTDVEAQFASPGETLFPVELVMRNLGTYVEEPPDVNSQYTAAMDPATRANGWTLVIASRDKLKQRVVFAHEWRGSYLDPLDPRKVLAEISEICSRYNVRSVLTDQYAADALIAIGRSAGINVIHHPMNHNAMVNGYMGLRRMLESGSVVLPNNRQLINDLLLITKKTSTNSVNIDLPRTQDGRHCDYAPALVLALTESVVSKPQRDSLTAERDRMLQQALKRHARKRPEF